MISFWQLLYIHSRFFSTHHWHKDFFMIHVYVSLFCLAAGIVIEEKNWPPFLPLIHHDITNEIPSHLQRMQYFAFASFLGMVLLNLSNSWYISPGWRISSILWYSIFDYFFSSALVLSIYPWVMNLYVRRASDLFQPLKHDPCIPAASLVKCVLQRVSDILIDTFSYFKGRAQLIKLICLQMHFLLTLIFMSLYPCTLRVRTCNGIYET